ncbi:MAG: condensation domain-containing protein [Gordonia sp. (in: high G+C Gram-positive bacteria)]
MQLRGFRIEFGEVEAALLAVEGVAGAAVSVVADAHRGDVLVGYVVAEAGTGTGSDAGLDVSVVRERVGARVPGYMVPAVVMVVDRLPLTVNGKLDRRALPAPEFGGAESDYVAPEGDLEEAVAAVYAELLGVEQISATASFFEAGGNSLSAMRVVARAGEVLGVDLNVRDLFEAPTVRSLVELSRSKAAALAPLVAVVPRPKVIPLSFAQQRMWFINQLDTSSSAYNIPTVLRLSGELDVDALRSAVVAVVARHEILRTTFPAVDGTPMQKIARASAAGARLDWAEVDDQAELESAVTEGFDVSSQWPIRVRVWEAAPEEHVLAVVMHHIASDGESMAPLVTDMVTAYLAERDDRDPEFSPLEVQFADFALWQHEVLGSPEDPDSVVGGQLEYWRGALAGLPDLVELPTDRPRPAAASGRGDRVVFEIPSETAELVTRRAREFGVTPFMVVHAALAALVSRLSAQDDIAIGTPIAGRDHAGLDRMIGMFVNTLILRTRVDGEMSFADLVEGAKAADLAAFANGDVPFETVVDALNPARSDAFAAFTQVWLTFDQNALPELAGADLATGAVGELNVSPVEHGIVPARVDLLVSVAANTEPGRDWAGSMTFAEELFDPSTVSRFAAYLSGVLAAGVADPGCLVGDLPLVADEVVEDVDQVTTGGRAVDPLDAAHERVFVGGGAGSSPVLLGEIFADAADAWGPRHAVVEADGSALTYAQIDQQSNRLARVLIDDGVEPGDVVPILIGRSAAHLVALWAVAKAGAASLSMDPRFDAEHVADLAAGGALGLTVEAAAAPAPSGDAPMTWLRLDDPAVVARLDAASATRIDAAELVRPVRFDDVAYLVPRDAAAAPTMVTHAGLAATADEVVRRSSADEYARVLGWASPGTDSASFEVLLATASGGVLVLGPEGSVGGTGLQDVLQRQAVTHVYLPPTVLETLESSALPLIRVVYTGGEDLPAAVRDEWAALRRVQYVSGEAETSSCVTVSEPVQIGGSASIGGPVRGVGVAVLDSSLRPVADGEAGDLYVIGRALARGYRHAGAETAGKFVANPYGRPGDRMFRTGAVVRWTTDSASQRVLERIR